MALSPFQLEICRLLASRRAPERLPQSYLAGGATLNALLDTPRLSRDVDLFHDTLEALDATWNLDRSTLLSAGYSLEITRERPGFVEALAARDGESVLLQWVRDSAFRFFPLMPHRDLGLTLHPFDLATNKILALVGRIEARDWVDALECHRHVSPLGLLAWAACGKDEGWNPQLILEEAARNGRASPLEWSQLEWQGAPPNPIEFKTQWRAALADASQIIEILPVETLGMTVLDSAGAPFRGDVAALQDALKRDELRFHAGHIGGAWPSVKTP